MTIKFDLKIILLILLFCFISKVEIYILLLLFAIIHELGHLFAGVILGYKPQEISITIFGMKLEFKPKYEEYNKKVLKGNILALKRAIIAIAGPLTNFIIILITRGCMNVNTDIINNSLAATIIYSNFLIGVFNLIPIYPLDGGRIVKEILHIKYGLQKSYKYTYKISKIVIILSTILSSIVILYIQNIFIIIILAYLWGLMLKEREKFYKKESINKIILEEKENENQTCKIVKGETDQNITGTPGTLVNLEKACK